MGNKVKYNLKNVYAAKLKKDTSGAFSYETPMAIPGAVNITCGQSWSDCKFVCHVWRGGGIIYYSIRSQV